MRIPLAGVVVCLSLVGVVQWKARTHVTAAGFWFEQVSFDSSEVGAARLGGPITEPEMRRIKALAWSELQTAYAGLRVAFFERRDAMYNVRVVQTTPRHPLAHVKWSFESAGESRVVRRLGGQGSVNFRFLANLAIGHAPQGAGRSTMIDGIARGLGRAAAHEFAHLFLATESIHRSRDVQSYEYATADRAVQYYGALRWDVARPMLLDRLGPAEAAPDGPAATASSSR